VCRRIAKAHIKKIFHKIYEAPLARWRWQTFGLATLMHMAVTHHPSTLSALI
jgi:hypothetical protein